MIGSNLKKIRTVKGFSREKLAEKSDISLSSLWKIETGKTEPNVSTLQKLAEALEVNVSMFFAESLQLAEVKEAG